MSTAIVVTVGAKSRRSSIRLASVSVMYKFTPVALPPGRLRLVTRPNFTGFLPTINTIGIVDVAALAASAGGSPPTVTITATRRRTSSVASSGSRSYWPSAQRYSIAKVLPSSKPVFFQGLTECGEGTYNSGGRYTTEESDHRRSLLCSRRERPCDRRATEKRNELTSLHFRTQA